MAMIVLKTERVMVDCMVKRKGQWNKEVMIVPDSLIPQAVNGQITIGPLKCSKPTIANGLRIRFSGGTELSWPLDRSCSVDPGGSITITVSP